MFNLSDWLTKRKIESLKWDAIYRKDFLKIGDRIVRGLGNLSTYKDEVLTVEYSSFDTHDIDGHEREESVLIKTAEGATVLEMRYHSIYDSPYIVKAYIPGIWEAHLNSLDARAKKAIEARERQAEKEKLDVNRKRFGLG